MKWMHQLSRFKDPKKQEDAIVWAGPVLVSDRLILVSSAGFAVSLSPYTGKLLGRVEIRARPISRRSSPTTRSTCGPTTHSSWRFARGELRVANGE